MLITVPTMAANTPKTTEKIGRKKLNMNLENDLRFDLMCFLKFPVIIIKQIGGKI
ncbi:hypothetical protein MHBO_000875 [Bonamia ostreae]|uniref:Uncharacterized protein n=1 Tax=Bonamia ostreae TaxID=126728 RepID=A0ABV2AH40_9EUKA